MLAAIWNEYRVQYFYKPHLDYSDLVSVSYNASEGFPDPLPIHYPYPNFILPPTYEGCSSPVRNFAFTGFHSQRFMVKGQPNRVYSVLSLPSLQLNTRFISLVAGQAMNVTQQAIVRTRQSRLLTMIRAATGTSSPLPSTVAWSHDGLYMGETGVQLAGHKLLLKPGLYVGGFETVQLDGVELPVSNRAVQLLEDGTVRVRRPSDGVVEISTTEVQFMLVNSDHFINLHSAILNPRTANPAHIDGLLGQTARPDFEVLQTAEFKRHIESGFLLPAGEGDIWSTKCKHNQYVAPTDAD